MLLSIYSHFSYFFFWKISWSSNSTKIISDSTNVLRQSEEEDGLSLDHSFLKTLSSFTSIFSSNWFRIITVNNFYYRHDRWGTRNEQKIRFQLHWNMLERIPDTMIYSSLGIIQSAMKSLCFSYYRTPDDDEMTTDHQHGAILLHNLYAATAHHSFGSFWFILNLWN